ncbi:biotin transporter BioY [Eshraghiella crossota]|uniref:biotin transporter BioY n=1 Tax=Eshraghiella crossota TaxID=45851 RepID=UPI003F7D92D1
MAKKYFNTKSIVLMALFAALLCVSAYISISLPIPGAPHLTLVNFMVLLISFVLPAFQPALVVAVWMLLGIVGVPVFIGGATGIGYLIGPWGGYTLSFIVVAILAPIVRGKKYNRIKFTILSIAAALLIDFLGMLWLTFIGGHSIKYSFTYGFVPFLPLDLIKAVVVAQIVPLFRKVIAEQSE